MTSASRVTALPQAQPPAPPAAPLGPAQSVQQAVGTVLSPITGAIDSLNLGVARLTEGFAQLFPKMGAARLWSDIVFQFGHSHPHPPTFGFPLPSVGPILAAGAQGVLINGFPAARCGDLGLSVWCGGYFPIFEILTGSSHVFIGGARASRTLLDPTLHCLPVTGTAGLDKLGAAMMAFSAGMSALSLMASMEGADAAAIEASSAQADANAAAEGSEMAQAQLVALEGTEEEAGAMLEATTAAMDAASAAAQAEATAAYAAAQGVGVATAAKQLAADIVGLAMAALIGKDPGVGFPFGLIITGSPNVLIGGFPMPGWALILKGLGKLLKATARGIQLLLPKGWRLKRALCMITGHPVDAATGRMFTSQTDFDIDGRIPVIFQRSYDTSAIDYEGPLGWGWTHPYDVHLWEDHNQGMVVVRDEEARVIGFKLLEIGEETYNPLEKLWLKRTGEREYELDDRSARIRRCFGVTDHDAPVSGRSESGPFRLIAIEDRNNNTIRLEYFNGLLSALDDQCGCRLIFTYGRTLNGGNRLAEIRQQIQRSDGKSFRLARYAYNEAGELVEAADRGRIPWRYYYEQHLMVREMNRNGLNFYFEYEGSGPDARCVHTWGDGHIYERWILYNPRARVSIVKDGLGGSTTYHFNNLGLVVKQFDALGGVKQFEYGPAGELLSQTDEILRTRAYTYDEHYNCTGVVQEDGSARHVTYNELCQPVGVEDEMEALWRREYDERGNVVTTIDPLGARREFKYNSQGDLVELVDALGGTTHVTWDRAGQLKTITRPGGVRTTYENDEQRQLVEVRDEASALSARYEYDRVGRIIKVRDLDIHGQPVCTEEYEYDPEGNRVRYVDGFGYSTRYRYAGFNKIVERADAIGYRRRAEYDREERILRIENEREESYTFEYDALDRTTREVDFDGSQLQFEYDPAGQVTRQIDAAGRATSYMRDLCGRITGRLRADLTSVEYGYDRRGRLIAARNSDSEITFVYDAACRLMREEQNGSLIEYEYDAEGQRLARRVTRIPNEVSEADETASPARLVEYEYDANGGLASIRAAGDELQYRRDSAGRLAERELPNGIVDSYRYDSSGRLAGHRVGPRMSGEDIVRRTYQWNAMGNLIEVNDSQRGTRRYTYSAVERLERVERLLAGSQRSNEDPETGSGGEFRRGELPADRRLWQATDEPSRRRFSDQSEVEEFQYDGGGNLIERTTNRGAKRVFDYGRGDRLEGMDGTVLIYDAAGNLTEKRRPNGSSIWYEYDGDDQLIAVRNTDGGTIEFSYDALGRRTAKRSGKREVGYLWDGDALLEERHTDREEGRFKEAIEYVQPPESFVPAARIRWKADGSFESEAYHVDYLGTPREVTNGSGEVAWKADYDEYGRAQVIREETEQPIRLQGQYEDSETGLHYNRFRYYDPESCRYISKDPIRLMGGLNHYQYTPDPVNWVDPYGLKACTSELEYVHQQKKGKRTNLAELRRQVRGQIAAFNAIIKREGMEGLKKRIRAYGPELEQEGRAHVKGLTPAPEGQAWLHEPDMRAGGRPTDVTGLGDRRTNSIIGGQATRVSEDILKMPNNTTKIVPKITVLPPK